MLLTLKPKPFLPHVDPNNLIKESVLRIRILCFFWRLDPGSGFGIRDGKKSGSGMSIPDHFSESRETVFWLKICNNLIQIRDLFDPGSGMFMPEPGSGINIPDPQH
jgi:hypothetical protein